MGIFKGVVGTGGDFEATRAGLAGRGTGRCTVAPPPDDALLVEDEELLMILSILNELTRPPLLCLGGEAPREGLPAPPPSLLDPRLSVLMRCLLMLGDPFIWSKSDLFRGEMKWGEPLMSI